MPELHALDPRHARMIWYSVEGERFVRALRGEAVPLPVTRRGGYGNSKVLAPECRVPREAWLVGRWLLGKAAMRLRRDGRLCRRVTLTVQPLGVPRWAGAVRTHPTADTAHLLKLYRRLWQEMRRARPEARRLLSLGVHLGEVIRLEERTGDLFLPVAPGALTRREEAARIADLINRRYGAGTIRFGVDRPHPGFFERG